MEEKEMEKLLEMKDEEYQLLNKMVAKINEARTYNIISGILTLLWVIECFFEIFWIQKFDGFYWVIWIFCMVGWYHMNQKFRGAMNEYNELKEEYNSRYEDNF